MSESSNSWPVEDDDRADFNVRKFARETMFAIESAAARPTPGGAGTELSVEARVKGLDGSERIILLNHIAWAYPDVVEAGFALVAEWRAESAKRRRKALRRREHDKRRRRHAELGDG